MEVLEIGASWMGWCWAPMEWLVVGPTEGLAAGPMEGLVVGPTWRG